MHKNLKSSTQSSSFFPYIHQHPAILLPFCGDQVQSSLQNLLLGIQHHSMSEALFFRLTRMQHFPQPSFITDLRHGFFFHAKEQQ